MACGKTAVGRELASRLGWSFIDLDARIELREQLSIPEIFRARGEAAFRQAETAAIRDILNQPRLSNMVVALGGGAFTLEENRDLLQTFPTVFLKAPPGELWNRSQHDGIDRPLRQDRAQFESLYLLRLPSYRKATLTVDTLGQDLSAICMEIENGLGLR
jgi:shikimate kinase